MKTLTDADVRLRAYLKWEAAGRPNLLSNEERNLFWFAAQRELLEESSTELDGALSNGSTDSVPQP